MCLPSASWWAWLVSAAIGFHAKPRPTIIHYVDVIRDMMASQITSLMIVYSTVYSDADQRKHQSSTSLAFVRGIHRRPVNPPHKWPVTRKMLPFDDVIMRASGNHTASGQHTSSDHHCKASAHSTKSGLSTSHYNDVIMGAIASQFTSLMIVYSTVYSDADQRKHQSSASLAFGGDRWIPRTNGQ